MPSSITVFQCFLFIWYPGATAAYVSRSSIACSGSHFKLMERVCVSVLIRIKIFPFALKTKTVSSNGNSSLIFPSFPKQYERSDSRSTFILFVSFLGRLNEYYRWLKEGREDIPPWQEGWQQYNRSVRLGHNWGANETPKATDVTYLSDVEYWFNRFGNPYIYRASANPLKDRLTPISIPPRADGASVAANP